MTENDFTTIAAETATGIPPRGTGTPARVTNARTSARVPTPRSPSSYPLSLAAATQLVPTGVSRQLRRQTLAVNTDNYRWIPDASVDLVLTDPPYNIAQDTNFHTYENNTINSYRFDADKGWDSYEHTDFQHQLQAWSTEIARVLRRGGTFAVFCADTYVSHLMDALETAGLNVRRTVTWRKPNAVPINRKTMMMSACEYVVMGVKGNKATFRSTLDLSDFSALTHIEQVIAADKAAVIVDKHVREAVSAVTITGAQRPAAVKAAVAAAVAAAAQDAADKVAAMYKPTGDNGQLQFNACVPNYLCANSHAGNRLHPTEKPVSVLRYLAALLSRPGDLILDPFGGSGSTGEAASSISRRAIVIERDDEFYTKLTSRLARIESGDDD